jgi:hypothetical protein
MVTLSNKKSYTISRLVAMTFIPTEKDITKLVVNHINENKLDNRVVNLEWITQKENVNASSKETCHRKEVIQKDLDGNIINTYNSINDAAAAINLTRHSISKVLKNKNKTAGGYIKELNDIKSILKNLYTLFYLENADRKSKIIKKFIFIIINKIRLKNFIDE